MLAFDQPRETAVQGGSMAHILLILIFSISSTLIAQVPLIIGIAGGTGSGKTTLAKKIQASLEPDVVLIEEDCYYHDLAYLPVEERDKTNFDHPDSIDFAKLYHDLLSLKAGNSIEKPIYDFVTGIRKKAVTVASARVIIVEGILILNDEKIRGLLDLKLYIKTDDDLRVLRRIDRNMREHGRTFESLKHQYLTTVKPMHMQYVEPSKQYADMIISGNSDTSAVLQLVLDGLRNR